MRDDRPSGARGPGLSTSDAYADLPEELRPFFTPAALVLPESVRTTIRDGWALLPGDNRRRLVQRLEREEQPVLRVLLASITATKALLGATEKPARDLNDNLEFLRQSAKKYQDMRNATSK